MRLAAWIVACLLGFDLLAALVLAVVGYRGLFRQKIRSFEESKAAALRRGHYAAELLALGWEEFSVVSPRGFDLKGSLLASGRSEAPTVLLLHGITWNRYFALKYCHGFLRAGWNLAAMDLAGHGGSVAPRKAYPTYGIEDKFDVAAVLAFLRSRFPESRGLGLVGESLGAGVALQCAALGSEQGGQRLSFVVADCPFSDALEELDYQLRRAGTPRWLAAQAVALVSYLALRLRGLRLAEASPIEAVRRATTPLLFVHGAKDGFVPTSMSVAMYGAATEAGRPAELFLVPGAGHGKSWDLAPCVWESLALDFAERAMAGEVGQGAAPRAQSFPLTEARRRD